MPMAATAMTMIWAPMKGTLRAVKPREEGLISSYIKPNEA
jgi:putative transposase